jgi:hypothetical protein
MLAMPQLSVAANVGYATTALQTPGAFVVTMSASGEMTGASPSKTVTLKVALVLLP